MIPGGIRRIPDLDAEATRLAGQRQRPRPVPLSEGDVVQVRLGDGSATAGRVSVVLVTADSIVITAVREHD